MGPPGWSANPLTYNGRIPMTEWKETCNLPRTAFSMKANLQTAEPEAVARWDAMDLYARIRQARSGRAEVPPARRPALRQRRNPHRHGAEQDPQGFRGQVPQHAGLRRALPAGLGLPRPAHRTEGRPRTRPEEARDVHRRLPPRLPQVRREVRRHPARGLQAPRHHRQVGRPLPDDGLPLPGSHRARPGRVCRRRHGLQGQEAGALVHPLPHRPGRSRGRVRAARLAVGHRRVPAERGQPRRGHGAASRRWPGGPCRC